MIATRTLTGPLLAVAVLFAVVASPAAATPSANGTIKVLKGGDRDPAQNGYETYATGLAGAVFEYSTSSSFASIAGTFAATNAAGEATLTVPAGTYYVREKTSPAGWTHLGPVQSLYFDPSSNDPSSARDYVSKVKVTSGDTTVAFPNQHGDSEQDSEDDGSPFINVRDNAAFPNYCGTKIQLVLDRSGSIDPYKNDYKAAVNAFIDALDNTPTQIAITSFNRGVNGDASGGVSAQAPLSLATPGNAATLKSKVAAVYDDPQAGTDWDAALRDAATRTGFAPTPSSASARPDMVVFITDGNPTAGGAPNSDSGSDVDLLDLTYGMASANLVKNQTVAGNVKMKLFAVGVGNGVTAPNLKAVSGPNDDLDADPDYAATSILALTNKLKEIAGRTCGARIVVRKMVVGTGDDSSARTGWNFGATSGASVSYSDPDSAAPYSTNGNPAQLTVTLNGIPAGGTNVAVTEDASGQPLAPADYALSTVVCETGQFGSGNTVATTSVARGFSLASVQRNSDLFCTFTNSVLPPNVTLTKTTSTPTVDAGSVAKFAVKIDNAGPGPGKNVVVSDVLPAGPAWTADGTLPTGCVIADVVVASVTRQKVTCTLPTLAMDAPLTFEVKATTSAAECATYVNTVSATADNQAQIADKQATVTCLEAPKLVVVKHVVNDDGGTKTASHFSLQVDDPGSDPPPVTGAESPGTAVTVDAGTYSVTEGAHDGYAVTYSDDCKNTTIGFGETKTCTVTNDDIAPTLTVVKHVVNKGGSNAQASDFTMHVTGNPITPSDFAGAESPGVTRTLATGPYDVSETGAATADYAQTRSADCSGTLAIGDEKTCTITNTRKTGSITVRKNLVPADDGGRFDLTIDGEVVREDAGDEDAATIEVATGTHTVGEAAGSAGALGDYVSSIACSDESSASGNGPLEVRVGAGEELTCTITNARRANVTIRTVTQPDDPGKATPFGFASSLPETAGPIGILLSGVFSLADLDAVATSVAPGEHSVTEDNPTPLGYKLVGLTCTEDKVQNSTVSSGSALATDRHAALIAEPGESIVCTFTNRKVVGQAVVVKAGDTFAYHGDSASYTFAVSNTGNSSLHDVVVTDDTCASVSATPTTKQNDNGDALLDPVGADSTNPEVWIYTCSYTLAAHQGDETNAVVNTATVTGADELDRPVGDTDQHTTTLLHPSIALTKTGPATAVAGSRVLYAIAAKNTGDVAFAAALVVVTDARCEAPPLLMGTGGDASAGTLDPGDTWQYACAVQSAAGERAIHNIALADGTDIHGHHATAQATADTVLTAAPAPPRAVAANVGSGDPVVAPAGAKLRGPTGCMPRAARIVVTGTRIAQVTFTVDGRRKRVVKKADSAGRFVYSVAKTKLRGGTHRVRARVVFQGGSSATAKTLVMTLNKCRPAVVKPRFTG